MAPDTQQTELFEEIAALAQERLGGGELDAALSFIALYYAGVSQEDLAERRPDDLYGAAVAHLNLARRRAPGEAKVRVYNPEIEQHGWQSTHTIVEIVTDDLPFLVDSVRMVLNARGYTSHLVIHPVLRVRRGDKGSLEAVLPVEEAGGGEPASRRLSISRPTGRRNGTCSTRSRPRCLPLSATCGSRWRTGAACASGCALPSRSSTPCRRPSAAGNGRR